MTALRVYIRQMGIEGNATTNDLNMNGDYLYGRITNRPKCNERIVGAILGSPKME